MLLKFIHVMFGSLNQLFKFSYKMPTVKNMRIHI